MAVEAHLGFVKEGFEALDLDSLKFQQSTATPSYLIVTSRGDVTIVDGIFLKVKHMGCNI